MSRPSGLLPESVPHVEHFDGDGLCYPQTRASRSTAVDPMVAFTSRSESQTSANQARRGNRPVATWVIALGGHGAELYGPPGGGDAGSGPVRSGGTGEVEWPRGQCPAIGLGVALPSFVRGMGLSRFRPRAAAGRPPPLRRRLRDHLPIA